MGERLHVDAPKGKLPTDLRAQIAERKAGILAYLGQQEACKRFVPPPIKPRGATDPAPLSFAQERLWFLEQLEPGKALYNICRVSRIVGNLNVSALQASLNETVRRHEVLRSSIRFADGRTVQIVNPAFEITLAVADLEELSDGERKLQVLHRIEQAVNQPFDFSAGRFLRAKLLRTKKDEHVLILTTHHIVSDAWSLGLLMRELWSLYEAYTLGHASPLKDLDLQYSDFASWQRAWLQGASLEQQVSYWKNQLKDLTHLNLPTDRSHARQSFHAAKAPIILPETLTTAINTLSTEFGVTPFMTLLAAFQVLLYRYCDQEDIVVGSPIANRTRTELECLIGFFVNTLVLRSNLSGNPTFKELLVRVREVCVGAYAHQDLPFEKLVQELQPERDPSSNPLFQVLFVLQNATQPFTSVPGLEVEPIERQNTLSQFDLSLFLRERDGKYIGYFEYNRELFDRKTIERMTTHYRRLLEAVTTEPHQSIATLPIMNEAELHKILIEWNATATDYPKDECIHHLFEKQAERTPEAIAVAFEDQQITYRELNQRANQLAHFLIALEIGPEKLVGICVERSIQMVVGLLGILKAGGAYVPLDPTYPEERLNFMTEDAQVSVLLTTAEVIEDLRWKIEGGKSQSSIFNPRLKLVCLDRDAPNINQQCSNNPLTSVTSTNLAYVIYTSGSTGQPKGVQITHCNVVNLVSTTRPLFSFNPNDVWSCFHSYAFDFSVWEIWGCITSGGRLVLVPSNISQSPAEFWNLLLREGVTVLNQTPTSLSQVLLLKPEHLNVSRDSSLRLVVSGGESLSRELACSLLEWGLPLWNFYGPTEATVWATVHQVKRSDLGNVSIPIGTPLPNTQVYILDSRRQPVPIGVPGEVYIAGTGLSRGYVNRPDLDADKFVAHQLAQKRLARLYKTGDIARYLSTGTIEFMCRRDHQVKLRGYRVELGEIESVLNQHEAVRQSVAIVYEDEQRIPAGEKVADSRSGASLVVYAVPSQRHTVSVNELRRYLKRKLPGYMVPSKYVLLDTLPQNQNGKIERQALLSLHTKSTVVDYSVAPRTKAEELITQIWTDVLKVESVALDESFFDLGGHSLIAIQILSRLREMLRCEIPLRLLFEAPTVAELARSIEKLIPESTTPELPPIIPASRNKPIPLSTNQEHLWTVDQMIPGTHFFNVPLIYQLSGNLNVEALQNSLKEIIRRHEILRTAFPELQGRPVQIVQSVPEFQLPVVDAPWGTGSLEQRVTDLILEERNKPFSLTTGPVLRIKLLRLTDSKHFLLITMHHIICDQWSIRLFSRELATFYERSLGGRVTLPDPPLQFGDFAVWERRSLDTTFMKTQLTYWRKQLSGISSTLSFGKMSGETSGTSFRTSRIAFELSENLTSGIKALARTQHCTPFMVFIAVFSVVLFNFTNESDIRIATLVANRRRKSTELTLGHFVNTVVLRIGVRPDSSFGELLTHVREVTMTAYTHQELPFEQVAQALAKDNDQRVLLFQVLCMYQSSSSESIQTPGLAFAPLSFRQLGIDPDITITGADLLLDLRESSTNLVGSLIYKINVIDHTTASHIVERLTDVLGCLLSSPKSEIPKFTSGGRDTLPEWT